MAYYGGQGNIPVGGYPAGFSQTPGGFLPTANVGVQGSGAVYTIGTNLPSVDPNNYSGTVHFGPSTTTLIPENSQFLPGSGFVDPNGVVTGSANFNGGY